MSAMQRTDWTLPGQSGEEEKGQRAPCTVTAGALFCPCNSVCTLERKQPFHVAGSCLSLLALGRRGARNNQAGTSTCGTVTVVASGQARWLPAQHFLWPPPPHPPLGASIFPFTAFLRVSPGGWRVHYRPGSSARYYLEILVPPCPCRSCWHSPGRPVQGELLGS